MLLEFQNLEIQSLNFLNQILLFLSFAEKIQTAIVAKKAMKQSEIDISDEIDPETKLFYDYLMTKYLCLLK